MPLNPIFLQPWGYWKVHRCYRIMEVNGISKMIFWDDLIFYLVFALVWMRIMQLPASSRGYPTAVWGHASCLPPVFYSHFVHSSSDSVISDWVNPTCIWGVRRLHSWDLLIANMFLMNEVPLSFVGFLPFDLLSLAFCEQERSEMVRRIFVVYILRRGQLKVCTCVHACMCASIYACICVHTCVLIYVHMHAPCVCVCLHLWTCVSMCTVHIRWSILYPPGVSEGIKDIV